ncbi:MAG: hypothetical protein ACI8XV_000447 [Arenicella sp.]|jgi:hypothetical protein
MLKTNTQRLNYEWQETRLDLNFVQLMIMGLVNKHSRKIGSMRP